VYCRSGRPRFPEPALNAKRSEYGSLGVVLVGDRRAKQRHQAIVQKASNGALESLDLRLGLLEEVVREGEQAIGAEAIGEHSGVSQLATQERCQFVLAVCAERRVGLGSSDCDWLWRGLAGVRHCARECRGC
jgi:hypothetical protein